MTVDGWLYETFETDKGWIKGISGQYGGGLVADYFGDPDAGVYVKPYEFVVRATKKLYGMNVGVFGMGHTKDEAMSEAIYKAVIAEREARERENAKHSN